MKNLETKLEKKVIYQETDYLCQYKISHLLSQMADLATINAVAVSYTHLTLPTILRV